MKQLNKEVSFLIVCIFLCLLPLSRTHGFAADPQRISPVELKRLMDSGEDVGVVDVRSERAYEDAHIRSALSMPFSQIQARHGDLPKDRLIVFY